MVNQLNNLSVLVGSINKVISNAATKGVIRVKELYLLNLVYKLIIHQCDQGEVTPLVMKLNSLYYKLLNKYSYLCKAKLEKFYELSNNLNPTFDAYTDPVAVKEGDIYHWQENGPSMSLEEIKALITVSYYEAKEKDTYESFESGKTISYSNVGRIVFVDSASNTVSYEIKDVLGNEISSMFEIKNVQPEGYTTIISKNIYSFGDVYIKIKRSGSNTLDPLLTRKHDDKFNLKFN
jgi:hypothetical protein